MVISTLVRAATIVAVIALAPLATVHAQEAAPEPTPEPAPEADPADVESIDAIIAALYEVISGPAGPRDWDRLRSLFTPGATLAPGAPNQSGEAPIRVLSVEEYIGLAGPQFERRAFYETESGRTGERFGNVASLMSGYESRTDPAEEPFQRGVNAITLLHDGARWYVLSIAWDVDRPDNPIPEAYR